MRSPAAWTGLRISNSASSALSAEIPKPSALTSLWVASEVGASSSQKSASTSRLPAWSANKRHMRRATLRDDERVVALDPAVRGEDEEAEPDGGHRAVLGDRLPVELDDVVEPVGVVAPAEAEPLGADPVLVGAGRAGLDLLMALCLEDRGQADPGLRGDLADLLRRLEDVPAVLRPELGDQPPATVGVGLVP